MSRFPVILREAVPADADVLATLWAEVLRRSADHRLDDLVLIIDRAARDADQRLIVAEADGHPVAAVLLRVGTLTPLNLEPVVQAISPHVDPDYRRRGVGRMLIEAAVAFAEERGIGHVATGSASSSRNANRFMARLGLAPTAVLRVAPTHIVRAKLAAIGPAPIRDGLRNRDRVLASRRVLRRDRVGT